MHDFGSSCAASEATCLATTVSWPANVPSCPVMVWWFDICHACDPHMLHLLPCLCALQAAPCATAVSLAQHGGVAVTQAGVGAAAAKADGASAAAAKTTSNSANAVAVSNGGSAVSAADNRPL